MACKNHKRKNAQKNRGLNLGFHFDWKLYYLRVTEASLL